MGVVFRGKFFSIVHEPVVIGGRTVEAEWVTRADGVRVILRRDDGHILLSDEYRSEINARDLRLPGGKVDEGDTAEMAAVRELREETGYFAAKWTQVGTSQAFATVRYRLHYFEASSPTHDPIEHDEGEDIQTRWVAEEEVLRMALDGRIGEDLSALQLIRYFHKRGLRL